jgi:hypothetical protein
MFLSTIPSFRCYGGFTDAHTYRQQGDLISLLLFFQNKESGQKMKAGLWGKQIWILKTIFLKLDMYEYNMSA